MKTPTVTCRYFRQGIAEGQHAPGYLACINAEGHVVACIVSGLTGDMEPSRNRGIREGGAA